MRLKSQSRREIARWLQVVIVFVMVAAMTGCVSKSKARKQRQVAFVQGQNSGMIAAMQAQVASVTVLGEVKNRVLAWSRDMTIATAFLQAEYQGITDPRAFVVRRAGQQIRFEAGQLLNGEDFVLEPGDVLEIQQ